LQLPQVRAWFLLLAVDTSSLPLLSPTFVANTPQSVNLWLPIFSSSFGKRRELLGDKYRSRISFYLRVKMLMLLWSYRAKKLFLSTCKCAWIFSLFSLWKMSISLKSLAVKCSFHIHVKLTLTYHFVFLRLYEMHAKWIVVEWVNRYLTFG
jgi:hypothetical protein